MRNSETGSESAQAGATRWQVAFDLPFRVLGSVEAALEPLAEALMSEAISEGHPLENRPDDLWRLRALAATRDDCEHLARAARDTLVAETLALPRFEIMALPARDWAAHVERDSPPIARGRFFIHAAHHDRARAGGVALRIEAGTAFGSGRHATTQACLGLIERRARYRPRVRRALDLGAGSGILAVAIAKLWHCPVIAADIDAAAVEASRNAARINRVSAWLRPVRSAGFRARTLRRGAPFDLICANILSGPLVAMAPCLGRFVAPGGLVILSGILRNQESSVIAAYRAQGLALKRRIRDSEWSTLGLAAKRKRY